MKDGFEKEFEFLDSNVIPKDTKDPDFFRIFIENRDKQIKKEHPERFIPRCKTADVRLRQNIIQERQDEKKQVAEKCRENHEKKVEEFKQMFRFIS